MLINAEDLDTSPPRYAVDKLIPEVGVGFGYGPSYTGKSLVFGVELGLAIANGTPFFGHPVIQGSVIYCLGEGLGDAGVRKQARLIREQADRQARAAAIEAREGPEAAAAWLASLPPYTDERLFVQPYGFSVPVSPDMTPGRELRQMVTEMGQIPDLELVILDSAADFTGLSLANDTSAKRFMTGLKWMQSELDCCVFVIAHPSNKGREGQGLPGTRLFASSDFVYGIQPDPDSPDGVKTATITAEKVKSGPLPDAFAYVIEPAGWHEPARDDTGELTGAEPVWTTSATVRLREDDQGGGGLRLPGSKPRRKLALPPLEEVPAKPRKRNGIRRNAGFRPDPAQESGERERLAAAILSVPCSGIAGCEADPRRTCTPVPGTDAPVPLYGAYAAHVERMTDAIVAGRAGLKEVTATFGDGRVTAPEPAAV